MPSSNKPRHRKPKADRTSAQASPIPLDMQAVPRAAQALRLRRLGYTYAEIAKECGYKDESGARKVVKNASRKIINDEARELVSWQLEALDEALAVVRSRIRKNDEHSLWAVDRLSPLLKRQSELMGLDVKVESQKTMPVVIEIPARIASAIRGEHPAESAGAE